MSFIKFFTEVSKDDVGMVGGKGASLGEMAKVGIPVPAGFVVTTDTYKEFSKQELPVEVKEEILKAFDELGAERVAVRSSAVAEDGSNASWAGQLESYLNVTRDGLIEAIRECWNSIQTERALSYAARQNLNEEDLTVGVVIQKMVESEVAGVIFTANPVTRNLDEIMIEAGYGLGEMLVQGMITPDNFLIDKKTLEIKERNIDSQLVMMKYVDGRNQEVEIAENKQDQAALDDEQVIELAKLAVKIENHYGKPQDIEWALENKKFYIVQSRPITTLDLSKSIVDILEDNKILLTGLPASQGVVTGKVRIIHSLDQLVETKTGEILVAEKTTPDFIRAFSKISGVITDGGGITSHAAIVSRELGIPAVVGTKEATKVLKNGQVITIDGSSGKVYDGEVQIGENLQEKDFSLHKIGDDIEDWLTALTSAVIDTRELWPMTPNRMFPYFDIEVGLNTYLKFKKLKEKNTLINEIADLFERSVKIRYFFTNSATTSLKGANIFKVADITIDDQIQFTNWLFEILKYFSDDPFSLEGKNKVWDENTVLEFSEKDGFSNDLEFKKAVDLLSINLFTLNWSFYWDYFGAIGLDNHGPYKLGADKYLVVKDYYHPKPTDLYELADEVPFESIQIGQICEKVAPFISFGNRVLNQDLVNKYTTKLILLVGGKPVTDLDKIREITKKVGEISVRQTEFINNLEDMEIVRLGAKLSFYLHKKFHLHFGKEWYPEDKIEETIKQLGDEFIEMDPPERSLTIEEKRTLFDPRNTEFP